MTFEVREEFSLSPNEQSEIRRLLAKCFPDEPHTANRNYFKQVSPWRCLLRDEGRLIAQAGLEYRVIAFEESVARIFGMVDLCVTPDARGRGHASRLLEEIERFATKSGGEFLVLFATDDRLYVRNGFRRQINIVRWVKIHEHTTVGIGEGPVAELMAKPLSSHPWPDGNVDLLGHIF